MDRRIAPAAPPPTVSSSGPRPSRIAWRTLPRPPRGRTPRLNGTCCLPAGCICARSGCARPDSRASALCSAVRKSRSHRSSTVPPIRTSLEARPAGAEQFERSRTGRSLVDVLDDLVEFTRRMGAFLRGFFGLWAGRDVWRQRRNDQCESEQQLCDHQSTPSGCACNVLNRGRLPSIPEAKRVADRERAPLRESEVSQDQVCRRARRRAISARRVRTKAWKRSADGVNLASRTRSTETTLRTFHPRTRMGPTIRFAILQRPRSG